MVYERLHKSIKILTGGAETTISEKALESILKDNLIKNSSNLVRLFESKPNIGSSDSEIVDAIQKTNDYLTSLRLNSSAQIIPNKKSPF